MADLTGGCLSGRVRYTLTGVPALNGLCHCRNCQRYTGSTFEAVTVYPSASVTVQGDLKTYNDTGDSGKALYRRFCQLRLGSHGGSRGDAGSDHRAGGHAR